MDEGASIRRVDEEIMSDLAASPSGPARAGAGKRAGAAASAAQPLARRASRRPLLFALLPVALAVGGYAYVTGGKVVSTDNAYVEAKRVGVSTDVAGSVVAIEVRDNQRVKKGQVLYRLKRDKFQTALEGAKAKLGTVRDRILALQASYKLSLAQIVQAEADLSFYQTAFKRQQDLVATGAGTKANFDAARHDLRVAEQKIEVAKAKAAATLAQLGGDADQPLESNPSYLQAKSGVDNAQRELNDTIVTAPFDGVVTNVNAIQVGSYLQASQQAFSLVSTTNLWIEANPKETELTNVRPGQPATLTIDTYPGVEWKGVVDSISPASRSSFSLLPAQNTTGNWVKVVQRIPMRVRIEDLAGRPPLRVGMSVTVDVDTGRARGLPAFMTSLFSSDASAAKVDIAHD
jgi:membrane fusion protein, multidrug efflux system